MARTYDADYQSRILARANSAANTMIIKQHINRLFAERQTSRAAVESMNRKVSTAFSEELKKVGVDFAKIDSVSSENATKLHGEIQKFKSNTETLLKNHRPRLQKTLGARRLIPTPAPSNFQTIVRTPPYDIADSDIQPPNPQPPSTVAFVTSTTEGILDYFMDTPMTSPNPSNVVASAIVGIVFFPTFGSVLSPFFGIASANMTGFLAMDGRASCNFSGTAHTEGSVGWIVAQLNADGEIVGIVDQNYLEQYYFDVNWGSSDQEQVTNTSFTEGTTFLTWPDSLYEIYVWEWGNISASGADGAWASQAAGAGTLIVESITVNWNPFFFF